MSGRSLVVVLAALLAAVTIGYYLGAPGRGLTEVPLDLRGIVRPAAPAIEGFELEDHRGAPFGPDRLRGEWTLMFFGYTSCPDVCPGAMLTLRAVVAECAEAGIEPPQVVLVSVDPERDDAATLARYVGYFGADFVGVRGDIDMLDSLVRQVGNMYQRLPPDDAGRYELAHSASLYLIGPQGRPRAAFPPPHEPAAIAAQLTRVRTLFGGG